MAGTIPVHPFDSLLMFRTTGNLTQDESSGALQVWGGMQQGLAAQVIVPSAFGANDTILPKIQVSSDDSTYVVAAQYPAGAQTVPSGGLALIVPFHLPPGKWYVKLELDGTAASTTYNFGAVVAGIIPNPGHDWDRADHFTL